MDFSKYKPADDSWVLREEDLPQNSSVESEALDVGEGGQNGAILLEVEAVGEATLAEGKKVTLEVKTSADGQAWETLEKKEIAGAPAGRMLDYIFPPSAKRWCKLVVQTDDAAAAGKVSAWLRHVPR